MLGHETGHVVRLSETNSYCVSLPSIVSEISFDTYGQTDEQTEGNDRLHKIITHFEWVHIFFQISYLWSTFIIYLTRTSNFRYTK